jgi:hypothetical protein
MGEGTRYCATCERVTPPTPGRTRVCYVCDSVYAPPIEPGRALKTQRKGKAKRPVKVLGVKKEARRATIRAKPQKRKKTAAKK